MLEAEISNRQSQELEDQLSDSAVEAVNEINVSYEQQFDSDSPSAMTFNCQYMTTSRNQIVEKWMTCSLTQCFAHSHSKLRC